MTTADIEFAACGRIGDFAIDVDFRVPSEGVTALFGPSGCGKTTVLRTMAGLARLPGRFAVAGEIWQDSAQGIFRAPHERSVGYVFQEASLFPHLSVRGNLLYGQRRVRGTTAGPAFDDIVDLLGIAPLLARDTAALSGGERQRVAIGRTLLSSPHLLLMDEPLSALDRETKDDIIPYLELMQRNLKIPMVYVSHSIDETARLADRMIVMAAGRKVAEGSTATVLESLMPRRGVERAEMGVVLTARVTRHDPAYCLTYLDHRGQGLVVPGLHAAPDSSVRIRIHARDVSLALHRPEAISIRNILSGTIRRIVEEPETAYAEAFVDVGGDMLRASLTRASVAELGLRPGLPVLAMVKSIAFDGPS